MRRDLVAVASFALATGLAVLFLPGGIPRALLALPWVLFLPGWALARHLPLATWPPVARAAVASVGSIVLAALIALALGFAHLAHRPELVVAALAVVTLAFAATSPVTQGVPASTVPAASKRMVLAVALAIGIAGVAVGVGLWRAPRAEGYTEFWITGADGVATFPTEVSPGVAIPLSVVIVSHEGGPVTFLAHAFDETRASGASPPTSVALARSWNVTLEDGARHEEAFAWVAGEAGLHQLRIELDKSGEGSPYREVTLRVRVVGPDG